MWVDCSEVKLRARPIIDFVTNTAGCCLIQFTFAKNNYEVTWFIEIQIILFIFTLKYLFNKKRKQL